MRMMNVIPNNFWGYYSPDGKDHLYKYQQSGYNRFKAVCGGSEGRNIPFKPKDDQCRNCLRIQRSRGEEQD